MMNYFRSLLFAFMASVSTYAQVVVSPACDVKWNTHKNTNGDTWLVLTNTSAWGSAHSKNGMLPGNDYGVVQYHLDRLEEAFAFGFNNLSNDNEAQTDPTLYVKNIDLGFVYQEHSLYTLAGGKLKVAMTGVDVEKDLTVIVNRTAATADFYINNDLVKSVEYVSEPATLNVTGLMPPGTSLNKLTCNFFGYPLEVHVAKAHATAESPESGIIALSAEGGTPPYRFVCAETGPGSELFAGLAPGSYHITVSDSLNDSVIVITDIGLVNNWRIQRSIDVADTGYVKTDEDTTSASGLISSGPIPAGVDGFCELTIADNTNNVAFGFLGFNNGSILANYDIPFVNEQAIDTLIVFVDSLLMEGKISVPDEEKTAEAYANLHLINFKDGLVQVGFKEFDIINSGELNYTSGDLFKIQRNGDFISVYKNGGLIIRKTADNLGETNLLNGIFVTKGSSRISTPAYLPFEEYSANPNLPHYLCETADLNWVETRSFDGNGVIKSESKTFMDMIGRTVQSQTKMFSKNNVLVSEPLFDSYGRVVGQSLPAPSFSSQLCYVYNFIERSPGIQYTDADFDNTPGTGAPGDIMDAFNALGDVNNPKAVYAGTQGKLGWYYSNNNTNEPLVAADNLPYARTEFYNDGRVRRSAGVGTVLKMGSGHENRFIYTSTPAADAEPASNELNYVFPNRTYELNKDFSVWRQAINLNLQLFKTISINPDGKDQITYTNSAGQTIATCITGDGSGCVTHKEIKILDPVVSQEKIQNIYVPKTTANTLRFQEIDDHMLPVSTPTATPILKDLNREVMLVDGTDYTYDTNTGYFTFTGSYANKSLYLQVTHSTPLATPPTLSLAIMVDVDYTQWTLYFYDRKGRLLANTSPEDVICQTLPVLVQKVSGDGDPQNPCGDGRVAGLQINNAFRAADQAVVFIDIDERISPLYTLTDPVPANSFILKTDAQKQYEDSVYVTNDTLVRDTTIILNPADSGQWIVNTDFITDEEMEFRSQLQALETQIPANAMRGKKITYSGEYAVYRKLRGSDDLGEPIATIPYEYSLEGDDGQVDSQGGALIKYTPLRLRKQIQIDFDDPSELDKVIVKVKNPRIILNGFETDEGGDIGMCLGTVFVPGSLLPVLNGMNMSANPHLGFAGYTVPLPLNIKLANKYMYDEYDRLVGSISDDEGAVDYVYDQKEDKLLFTQNDKQRANGGKFSCIVYDKLGRPVVSGEYDPMNGGPTNGDVPYLFQNYYDHKNGITVPPGRISTGVPAYANNTEAYNDGHIFERTFIEYDNADVLLPTNLGNGVYYKQMYTAAKVSKTWNDQNTTWYSYDELGRQIWTVQNSAELGYKTMNYIYDFRGNLMVSGYQLSMADNMLHYYSYDADERLSTVKYGVYSTTDPNYVKPLASYSYYLHGPLKRTMLGNNLQGLDYVYTIDGKLKSVNNPVNNQPDHDPGLDGYTTGPNSAVSPDAFSYALEYYKGDYARAGSPVQSYNNVSVYNDDNISYTGQIKAMSWHTLLPSAASTPYTKALMYEYSYDELYRLTGATFGMIDETLITSPGHGPARLNDFTPMPEYKLENISYDKNGNIQTLKRHAAPINTTTAHLLDDLTYNYSSTHKNSLQNINDAATNTAGYTADLDLPAQSTGANYVYNQIGELIANTQEDKGFEYNSQGLTTRVFKLSNNRSIATFTYNDQGLRHSKTTYDINTGLATKVAYYVYGGGAQVASYTTDLTLTTPIIVLQDQSLYAAGRVATYDAGTSTAMFELTDQVGNVRAVVTANGSGAAQTISYTDYYPHGGTLPGRSYQSSLNFPYAYQGQQKDEETGLLNFELRQYDARIGRWYNPDPNKQHHSPYLAMGNNPVSSIDPDGGWDGDSGFSGDIWDHFISASESQHIHANSDDWINSMEAKANYGIDMHNYNEHRAKYYNSSLGSWGTRKNIGSSQYNGYSYWKEDASLKIDKPLASGVYFVFEKYTPNIYRNISGFLKENPKWRYLHYIGKNKEAQDLNRSVIGQLLDPAPNFLLSRDEFPMASTEEGGNPLTLKVTYVPAIENSVQGGQLSWVYRGLEPGSIIKVIPIPKGAERSPVFDPVPLLEFTIGTSAIPSIIKKITEIVITPKPVFTPATIFIPPIIPILMEDKPLIGPQQEM
ncbi:MAG: repeat-associated core domain protein [Bacteroidetes bacterium]|jgi:RHS repeat-associated protein|nr:repeat-associated core domain protein [Bacteroidota bacterium]